MLPLKYIRTDRNGTKYYEDCNCPRCGGAGESMQWYYTGGICYECGGTGIRRKPRIVKEYTQEYADKLKARRVAKNREKMEQIKAENEAREAKEQAEREAREAEERARKAISQHVGTVGDRLTIEATYNFSAWWEQPSFSGYGTETRYIHRFTDDNGNVLVWKTGSGVGIDEGEKITLTGTVKEHGEYNDEKQTVLLRCKIKKET